MAVELGGQIYTSVSAALPYVLTVNEDSGAYAGGASFVTNISPGPAGESGQVVSFILSNDNNALFAVQPAISASGTLTFTPAANANGSATVQVVAMANGGTANGGVDTSAAQTFTILVTAVNDAPTVANAIPNQAGTYGASFNYTFPANTFNDVDAGQTLSYTATGLPGGVTLTGGGDVHGELGGDG